MVKLAISDFPYFSLSTIESSKFKNSYSFETILELKEMNPDNEYYFIIGLDSLMNITKWKNPDIIFNETVILAVRGDSDHLLINKYIDDYSKRFNAKISIINCEKIDVSSTQIRQDIFDGNDITKNVPAKVCDYIKENRLYKEIADERQ